MRKEAREHDSYKGEPSFATKKHTNGPLMVIQVRYAEDIKEKLEDLSEPDKLRVARRTITQHLSLPALEQARMPREHEDRQFCLESMVKRFLIAKVRLS